MKDLPGLARANSLKLCLLQLLFNTICLLLFVLVLELISRAKPWGCIRMDLALLVPFFTRFLLRLSSIFFFDRPTDRPTDRRTDGPTDGPTDRSNDRRTDRPTDCPTAGPTDRRPTSPGLPPFYPRISGYPDFVITLAYFIERFPVR